MTEDELDVLEATGGKVAELVARYRELHWIVRKMRRLGYAAGEALVVGRVSERHAQTPSGQFMCMTDSGDEIGP